ncbi:uncharacterized protein L969DRAFT_455739 [Mixia osmundae IAM 14324]|uniref:uncharacterized protein n=1 Tax=Mixia osmundae (strain CBS 9802 / IAM 14324 / JCM 22182 / KY 12970) TaxID=764103 RepID=UPI0004A54A8B|nr:uncharacterized protein L969DRAFT_455739 [Mixia osmundae IAM 14324]KEI39562.1 hypothetical protein L969DRAFT_455739 [Mixia osmundae IAM 14324]
MIRIIHALNALFQEPIFTASELAQIAQRLDALELDLAREDNREAGPSGTHERHPFTTADDDYDMMPDIPGAMPNSRASGKQRERTGRTGYNADDTGFFSVTVVDEALKWMGLRLVRWASDEMKAYKHNPGDQAAFILNYQQHWFAMRRFGPPSSELGEQGGASAIWYNLNSFLPAPERISVLYLDMQLQQAQHEGYSIFTVVSDEGETHQTTLPTSQADIYVFTHPELGFAHAPEDTQRRPTQRPLPQPPIMNSTNNKSRSRTTDEDEPWNRRAAQRRKTTKHVARKTHSSDESIIVVDSSDEESSIPRAGSSKTESVLTGAESEEEQIRLATQASLAFSSASSDIASSTSTPHSAADDAALRNQMAAGRITSESPAPNLAAPVEQEEVDEDDLEEIEQPTPDEIRRRRLARFG